MKGIFIYRYLLTLLILFFLNVSVFSIDADTLETIKCRISASIQTGKESELSEKAIDNEILRVVPERQKPLAASNISKTALDSLFEETSKADEPIKFTHEKAVKIFMSHARALFEKYKKEEDDLGTDASAEDKYNLENKLYILASLVSDIFKDYIEIDED